MLPRQFPAKYSRELNHKNVGGPNTVGPITRGKSESGMLFAHKKSKLGISYVGEHFSILNLQYL